MNLLEETIRVLKDNNKNLSDILRFGTRDGKMEGRLEDVLNIEYYVNYWGRSINTRLILVGIDFWLERGIESEDKDEWWEFKTMPVEPTEYISLLIVDTE